MWRTRARAREGQTGCEATEWESETSVRCLASQGGRGDATGGDDGGGAGRERDGGVVGGWGWYERDGSGEPEQGQGRRRLTVQGAGMGLVAYTGRAREGQTGCEATEWVVGEHR